MSMFLSRIVRMAVRRLVYEPQTRDAVTRAARGLAGEAKVIAGEKDRARAAGRSLRRAMNKLQNGREQP